MTNLTTPSVQNYLNDLNRSLRDLPRGRRQEIVRDIRAHIDAALAEAPEQSPSVTASILDDLGTPEEIAAAARSELPPTRPRIATRDVATIVLVLLGGLVVPVVGWVIGVVLLWTSNAWRTTDKILATLLVPGGLGAALVIGATSFLTSATSCVSAPVVLSGPGSATPRAAGASCTTNGGPGLVYWIVLIVTVGGPLFTAFWLTRRARRSA